MQHNRADHGSQLSHTKLSWSRAALNREVNFILKVAAAKIEPGYLQSVAIMEMKTALLKSKSFKVHSFLIFVIACKIWRASQ